MSEPFAADAVLADGAELLHRLSDTARVVFDLDGTLYDARDFERPALAAVAQWVSEKAGRTLQGFAAALWARRETDRHRLGLFDDILRQYDLPPEWGSECAQIFRTYPAQELRTARSLSGELAALRARGCRLALVSNGRAELQQRKLALLGMATYFDICIYCDPRKPEQLKPASWAWSELAGWRAALPAVYVGDDPVDAGFARAGSADFIPFRFRSVLHED